MAPSSSLIAVPQFRFDIGHCIRGECRIDHDFDLIFELSFGNARKRDGASPLMFNLAS